MIEQLDQRSREFYTAAILALRDRVISPTTIVLWRRSEKLVDEDVNDLLRNVDRLVMRGEIRVSAIGAYES